MSTLKPNLNSNSPRVILDDAWVSFIEKFEPYHWYLTLTFEYPVTQARVEKQFKRFVRIINVALYGKRYREKGKGVSWVCAVEKQKRGVLHIHALIGGDVWRLRRLTFMDVWHQGYTYQSGKKFDGNGFARIEKYDFKLGARYYLSKYVTKGGEVDIFIPPYMQGFYGVTEGGASLKLAYSNN